VWSVIGLHGDTYPRNPDLDVQHYAFRLTLSDTTDEIAGETTVDARLAAAGVSSFALDLLGPPPTSTGTGMRVDAVTAGTSPLEFRHADGRLTIRLATATTTAGEGRSITIRYHGAPADGLIISKNRYGERTFFADNFPDRARHWLPTLDHPSDKATCEFIVTAPDRYRVIATGLRVEESDLPGGGRRTHWRTTVPVSTYNMVIGVARFAVDTSDRAGRVGIDTWAYPQDRDAWFRAFSTTRPIVDFYTFRIGPYPYEKLAHVESRTRFGGMENAGNIFYTEKLSVDRGAEGIAAHEIAHQWFGDSVTEADWHHAWLSEGFATYFTHLYREFTYGRERLTLEMQDDRRQVIEFARKNPDLRVVDPRLAENRVLSAYTYQKGGWILHMLRRRIGDQAFWSGIRDYYRTYRDQTALSEDFRDVMERAGGVDLDAFFQQWLYEPGYPRLGLTWAYDATAKIVSVTVDQLQAGKPFAFDLDLGFTFADGTRQRETIAIADRSRTVTMPVATRPVAVTVDPDVWLLAETASPTVSDAARAARPRSSPGGAVP
jgi:aminopeptidase N